MDTPTSGPFELASHRLGALPLINHFLDRIGLDAALGRWLPEPDRRVKLTPATAIRLLVVNLLVGRAPLYGLGEWAAPYAPGLLGTRDAIPSETETELQRLLPRDVVILGGTGAVSAQVESQLRSSIIPPPTVTRVAGPDREHAGSLHGRVAGVPHERRPMGAIARRACLVGGYEREQDRRRALRPGEPGARQRGRRVHVAVCVGVAAHELFGGDEEDLGAVGGRPVVERDGVLVRARRTG